VLAPAIQAGADAAIRQGLDRFVASDRFAELWDKANRRAHETVVALLTTGKSNRLTLDGDVVYLDLSQAVDRVKDRCASAASAPSPMPSRPRRRAHPAADPDGFSTARRGHQRAQGPELAAPAARAAVLRRPHPADRAAPPRLAAGRARAGGHRLLLLAVVGIGRTYYLDSINRDVLPKQAAADIFDALLALLRDSLRVAVIAAVVLALISLLVGKPARRAIEVGGPQVRAAAIAGRRPIRARLDGRHKAAVQWAWCCSGGSSSSCGATRRRGRC
jgi:hypothetical protein